MAWYNIGIGAAGIIAGGIESNSSQQNAKDAAAKAAAAAASDKVDVNALNATAQQQSISNAEASQALEKQMNPGLYQEQQQSTSNLLGYLNPNAYTGQAQKLVANQTGTGTTPINPGLLNAAAGSAQSDLALGGQLSQDEQNSVMRAGLAKAGAVTGPGGNLGLGRDISARDLGLTSLSVYNQRLQNASQIGGQQLSEQQAQAAQQAQNQQLTMQNAGVTAALQNQDYTQALGLANYGQNAGSPTVGLSPGDLAGISVGNQNMIANSAQQQAAIQAQQNAGNTQAMTALGTTAMGGVFKYLGNQNTPTSTNTVYPAWDPTSAPTSGGAVTPANGAPFG